ncbi:GTPase Era, mitochondrial [Salminus brasiliensis]|uniref:GTPase Era, mitochondrial n=1 Tax=Salminus brasiliensis TaxID=930266 RepID=UPI003B83449D
MALRVCEAFLRRCLPSPGRVFLLESASPRPRAAFQPIARSRGGFLLTSASYVSSSVFLDKLLKGKVAGVDQRPCRPAILTDGAEQLSLLLRAPDQPENPKCLRVAVIGAPNAGKSTLSNQLLGKKLFAVSKKVHTTRSRALGVLTENETQIILLDTPGLTTPSKVKRHHLEKSLLEDPLQSLREADLVVVLVDISDKWTRSRLDFEVLKCLALNPHIPAILVLNKVDLLKDKTLLLDFTAGLTEGIVNGERLKVSSVVKPSQKEFDERQVQQKAAQEAQAGEEQFSGTGAQAKRGLSSEQLRGLKSRKGWPHFKDVFMLCATDMEDVNTLKRYLMVAAKPGPWHYHSDVLTDQSPEDVCINAIRERLLEYLPQEVPYTISPHIELWREDEDGRLDISVKLHVRKNSHMSMVIGPGGQVMAKIVQEASEDLTNAFMQEVRLKISARLRD